MVDALGGVDVTCKRSPTAVLQCVRCTASGPNSIPRCLATAVLKLPMLTGYCVPCLMMYISG